MLALLAHQLHYRHVSNRLCKWNELCLEMVLQIIIVRYALIEAPCRPVKTGFPLLYSKLLGMRSLLQFNFPRQRRTKQLAGSMCAVKDLVNHVGKKVQVKGTVLEIDGLKQTPNQHRYQLTVKGIKLTNILNAFLAASAENLVKMAV